MRALLIHSFALVTTVLAACTGGGELENTFGRIVVARPARLCQASSAESCAALPGCRPYFEQQRNSHSFLGCTEAPEPSPVDACAIDCTTASTARACLSSPQCDTVFSWGQSGYQSCHPSLTAAPTCSGLGSGDCLAAPDCVWNSFPGEDQNRYCMDAPGSCELANSADMCAQLEGCVAAEVDGSFYACVDEVLDDAAVAERQLERAERCAGIAERVECAVQRDCEPALKNSTQPGNDNLYFERCVSASSQPSHCGSCDVAATAGDCSLLASCHPVINPYAQSEDDEYLYCSSP